MVKAVIYSRLYNVLFFFSHSDPKLMASEQRIIWSNLLDPSLTCSRSVKSFEQCKFPLERFTLFFFSKLAISLFNRVNCISVFYEDTDLLICISPELGNFGTSWNIYSKAVNTKGRKHRGEYRMKYGGQTP